MTNSLLSSEKESDFTTIRQALKALRRIGLAFKWGGGKWRCELAKRALEALDRIEQPMLKEMKERQL